MLARAKLLEGYRATVNYDVLDGFSEAYPGVSVTDHLFEIDRNKLSCSAGTAPLDMMLSFIERYHGEALAARISNHIFHGRIRGTEESQKLPAEQLVDVSHDRIRRVVEVMEQHIETPLSLKELSLICSMSLRQIQRRIKALTGKTPHNFYMELRLERARQYLIYTKMSVLKVAISSGFSSQEHFARCYKKTFKQTPSQSRTERRHPPVSNRHGL